MTTKEKIILDVEMTAQPKGFEAIQDSIDLLNKRFSAVDQMLKLKASLKSMGIEEEFSSLVKMSVDDLHKLAGSIKTQQKTIEERRTTLLKELGL